MISSTRNKRVASAARLKKRGLREQYRMFLLEGAQATAEGLAAAAVETVFHVRDSSGRVPEVVESARAAGVEVLDVSESVMAHLTSAVTPQGIVATARFVDVPPEELSIGAGVVPVLCSVRDPGNAGTILRSADAAGATGVAFTSDSVDVYNSKTVRASAGSLFHLPVVRGADAGELVGRLRRDGAQVLAADARGDVSMYDADLTKPTALLLGNEAWGLTAEVRGLADATVRVPIQGGAESLNLAAASALLLFEAARQRHGGRDDLSALIAESEHDLRLPLTAVKGFASTLVDRWDRFEENARRELVAGMLLDLDRLAAMVTLLVDVARAQQGRVPSPAERYDVTPLIEGVAALFARNADYPEVIVKGQAHVRVDPGRLQAILLALCEGAIWWGQRGPIEIESRTDGTSSVIEVRREGSAPAELEMLFGGTNRTGERITLDLAKRVVDAIGGDLTAETSGDLHFSLRLPL